MAEAEFHWLQLLRGRGRYIGDVAPHAARAYGKVKSPRWVIAVRCLSSRHRGVIAEADLAHFGVRPGAPVAQFVKRLRCRHCGSGSVVAQRTTAKNVA